MARDPRFFVNQSNRAESEAQMTRSPIGGGTAAKKVGAISQKPFTNFSNYPFTAKPDSLTAALNANVNRVYILIQNQGAVDVFISFGSPANGVKINPDGSYEMNINCPNSAIYIYTSSGESSVVIVEGTR